MTQSALDLLQEKKYQELRILLSEMNPVDLADLLAEFPEENLPFVFRILPKDLAAEAFVEMEPERQELLIRGFSDSELAAMIHEMYADDAVDIMEEMPANVVKRILRNADPDMRRSINEILKYPADSAGSIMTTEFVDFRANMRVDEAIAHLRRTGIDKETIYTCYVTDGNRKLQGCLSVKDLLMANDNVTVSDLMGVHVIRVHTVDDREDAIKTIHKYGFMALPVVDNEERLVGIVTVDDALNVMEEEATEDFVKMAAMQPVEDSYLKTSVWGHAKNRILWLMLLMISSTFTGLLLTRYEQAFAAVPLLVSFLPMLMDTGGNCGAQSSTMIIRGLATDELRFQDYFRVLFKEERIALLVAAVLVTVNTLRVLLIYGFHHEILMISLVLGITLLCVVLLAKALGCTLPMLARRIGLDPAIMASPLITTIVDACAVLVYFNVALRIMHLQL